MPAGSSIFIIAAVAGLLAGCRTPQGVVKPLPEPQPRAELPPVPPMEGGRDYWVAFQKNFRDFTTDDKTSGLKPADPLQLELFITGSETTTGYVEIPGLRFRKDFTMEPGSVVNIPIDSAAQIRSSGIVEKLGVHVVADHPVMVYGLNRRFQTTDTYIAYPTENLGSRYRAVCFRWLQNDLLSQFVVVATDDSTRVTIHPSATV
ncbi:MAG: hypothetical protein ABIR47_00990, partial [Candidatus Kapaibacterium sp.]